MIKQNSGEPTDDAVATPWPAFGVIATQERLDFGRPFLPDTLVNAEGLEFLSRAERLTLNQIRGYGYLNFFVMAKDFMLPSILDHVHGRATDDHWVPACLGFVCDEAKHAEMFRCFKELFTQSFGVEIAVVGPAKPFAGYILSHEPLAVALLTLQLEWSTQQHYLDSVNVDESLEPLFKRLLRYHWIDESEHVKRDGLIAFDMVARSGKPGTLGQAQSETALEEYIRINAYVDEALRRQVKLDLDTFIRATGRFFNEAEREEFLASQHQALRWTFIGSGMTHEAFLTTAERLIPRARRRIEQVVPVFC